MVSIIFLGTAGDSAVMSKQMRASGGIILIAGDMQFHIDPGPGALNQAKAMGINLHSNTAILVSHNHINHCNDINAVVDAMTHGGIEQHGIIMGSKSLLQRSENNVPYLTSHHEKWVERIIPLEKDHKVAIEHVEIHALSAEHTDPTAIGFKFFFPTFTLGYTGDTKLNPTLISQLKGTDVLILNVPFPGDTAKRMNLDTVSAAKIVAEVKPKLALLTHFGLEMLRADPLAEARDVQRATGIPTLAARDGLLINPDGYTDKNPIKGY